MNIALVVHSKILKWDNFSSGENKPYSAVMQDIVSGAKEAVAKCNKRYPKYPGDYCHLQEFSLKNTYSDPEEYFQTILEAIKTNPDILILPCSLTSEMFGSTLASFKGKIIAVNAPPNQEILERIKEKYLGYVGMNEYSAGETAVVYFMKLTRKRFQDMKDIIIVNHKKEHHGLKLRITGAKNKAIDYGKKIHEIYINEQGEGLDLLKKKIQEYPNSGIITLGIVGTKNAIQAAYEKSINTPIVGIDSPISQNNNVNFNFMPINPFDKAIMGMDIDPFVKKAIKDGLIIGTEIQHPFKQGELSILKAIGQITEENVYCGPTLITPDNVDVVSYFD